MGTFGTTVRLLLLAGALVFVPFSFSGDITKGEFKGAIDNPSKPEKKTEAPAPKRKTYPFHGTLASTDPTKNLFVLEGKKKRTIRIDSFTKITRNEATAALAEGKSGERVTGSVARDEQGNELAVSIKFAGMTAPTSKAAASKKSSP